MELLTSSITILLLTTASIGFFHTILGPDHYLPFIIMAKSGNWSQKKTILVTCFCGLGHVLSSVILGLLGIGLGLAASSLEMIESVRGQIAGWGLIAFGLVYMVWGFRWAKQQKRHEHSHTHPDGVKHVHEHVHSFDHYHLHDSRKEKKITPWVLFLIFVLGPCEPLIPILMYPAINHDITGLILVIIVFTLITILTMLLIVFAFLGGIKSIRLKPIERFSYAIAGVTLFLSGSVIQFLGL